MSYTKTTWVNNVTPINETNLNKIENELGTLDNNIVYSTDERVIGTWLDGKNIYRKTIVVPDISTYSTSYNITSLEIDKLVNVNYIAEHGTNFEYYNFYSSSTDNLRVFYRNSNNIQTLEIRINSADTFNFTFTLDYTKVND